MKIRVGGAVLGVAVLVVACSGSTTTVKVPDSMQHKATSTTNRPPRVPQSGPLYAILSVDSFTSFRGARVLHTAQLKDRAQASLSPDGKTVAELVPGNALNNDTIVFIDTLTGHETSKSLSQRANFRSFSWAPDGSALLFNDDEADTLTLLPVQGTPTPLEASAQIAAPAAPGPRWLIRGETRSAFLCGISGRSVPAIGVETRPLRISVPSGTVDAPGATDPSAGDCDVWGGDPIGAPIAFAVKTINGIAITSPHAYVASDATAPPREVPPPAGGWSNTPHRSTDTTFCGYGSRWIVVQSSFVKWVIDTQSMQLTPSDAFSPCDSDGAPDATSWVSTKDGSVITGNYPEPVGRQISQPANVEHVRFSGDGKTVVFNTKESSATSFSMFAVPNGAGSVGEQVKVSGRGPRSWCPVPSSSRVVVVVDDAGTNRVEIVDVARPSDPPTRTRVEIPTDQELDDSSCVFLSDGSWLNIGGDATQIVNTATGETIDISVRGIFAWIDHSA